MAYSSQIKYKITLKKFEFIVTVQKRLEIFPFMCNQH